MEEPHLLVQDEGRAAKHAAFSVSVTETSQAINQTQIDCDQHKSTPKKPPPSMSPRPNENKNTDNARIGTATKRSGETGTQVSRTRSASTGRDKKTEHRLSEWQLLQCNLFRIMEDIFDTCERNENIEHCQVILVTLKNYMRDFNGLIQYLTGKWTYENTTAHERPTSLAWEVRRTTPRRSFSSVASIFNLNKDTQQRSSLVEYLAYELELARSFNKVFPLALKKSSNATDKKQNDEIPTNKEPMIANDDKSEEIENETHKEEETIKSVTTQIDENESSEVYTIEINNIDVPKEEKSCQTDDTPSYSYTLDIEAELKNGTEIIPTSVAATIAQNTTTISTSTVETNTVAKIKVPARVSTTTTVTKPITSTVSIGRGTTRTLARGRGLVNDITKPSSSIQPRLVRSATETKVGSASARGPVVARRALDLTTRTRPATATGAVTQAKLPNSTRNNQALVTLPNRPNIGLGRGVKKLSENKASKIGATKTENIIDKVYENLSNFRDERSNSNSSITSSSSRSSWADKVKGGSISLSTTIESVHSVDDLRTKTSNKTAEDDGWKMVKVRSRSKISPVNSRVETTLSKSSTNIKTEKDSTTTTTVKSFAKSRFNQPSAARPLPSLALNVTSKTKNDKTSSNKKTLPTSKLAAKPNKGEDKSDNDKKSTLAASGKNGTIVKKKSMENILNDKNKIKEKETKTKQKMKEDTSTESSLEQLNAEDEANEKEDEEQQKFDDEVQRKTEELSAEEARLQKQINELETEVKEVEMENDDSDLSSETSLELGENLQAYYQIMLNKDFTGEEDFIERLKEFDSRQPGRAFELHQKLSSPSRKRNIEESLKCCKEKQAKAQEKRAQLMQEKWYKLQDLNKKIEEVRAAQAHNTELQRERIAIKLKRAADKRSKHIQDIVSKAHDEEEKLKEIAFINNLEAQNKRHDLMAQNQEHEERLQGIQEERQRKQEEKAAKEAAVEERKKIIEAKRQLRLEKMQERRREREERIDRELQEKEKERIEQAREKARDRDQRMQAMQAAKLANQEELLKKIQAKQEEYARRQEENQELIRQKASACCFLRTDVAPPLAPYDTHKICTLCNVLIGSEVYLVSHLRGRQHQEGVKVQLGGKEISREDLEVFSLKYINDAPASNTDSNLAFDKERQKALKKRCKKIKLRLAAKGEEYENSYKITKTSETSNSNRIQKCLKEVEKLISSQGKGLWSDQAITSLERSLAELGRILDKKNTHDQLYFASLSGFKPLTELFNLAMESSTTSGQPCLPTKCFITVCNTFSLACSGNILLCCHIVLSNKISVIIDLLLQRLTNSMPLRHNRGGVVGNTGSSNTNYALPVDNLAGALMRLLALLLEVAVNAIKNGDGIDEPHRTQLTPRVQDIISYAVSAGVFEKLAAYCGGVRGPIDEDHPGALFLISALRLLRALVACGRTGGIAMVKQDVSQLGATLRITELVGGVSMLYGMLLHQGAPPRCTPPPPIPLHIVHVAQATLKLLLEVAEMDLALFQGVLGAEGMSLQFRHLSSYLLWACQNVGNGAIDELLQLVIRLVGFFAVRNHDNQMTIQSGFTPTVLQQLCTLPFEYFMEEEKTCVLLPTLLACSWDNNETKAVLEQELSFQLLEDFRTSDAGKKDSLVILLQDTDDTASIKSQ